MQLEMQSDEGRHRLSGTCTVGGELMRDQIPVLQLSQAEQGAHHVELLCGCGPSSLNG